MTDHSAEKRVPMGHTLQTVDKPGRAGKREGGVCAGNPGRVPCAIQINRFQNFLKVLKS